MAGLIFGQTSLWLILACGIFGIWIPFLIKKRDDYEVPSITSLAFAVVLISTYALGMRYGTDVDDFCVLNGHVVSAEYEQEWTEEYWDTETYASGRDSKGNTTYSTRTVRKTRYHGPSWTVATTVGNWGVGRDVYAGYVNHFRVEALVGTSHAGQCSWGDGKTYQTRWNGSPDLVVPVSNTESVINWVKASKLTVLKHKGSKTPAPAYPSLVTTPRGPKQPRVILDGYRPSDAWLRAMEWNLDVLADRVGASKQCNPLMVITTAGPARLEDFKDQWLGAKKNDAVFVVGVKEWPKVEWAGVITWTRNQEFPVVAKNDLMDANLDDGLALTKTIESTIVRKFDRKPMADFEYLKGEIETPPWIVLLSGAYLAAAILCCAFIRSSDYSRPAFGHSYYR